MTLPPVREVALYKRQPRVGWNLKPPRSDAPYDTPQTTPVISSFASPTTLLKFGTGPARWPLNGSVKSRRSDCFATITGSLDKNGSPTAVMALPVIWPGKTAEMLDWKRREGFGSRPAYLDRQRRLVAAERPILGTFMSEPTLRATEHPLSWAKYRRQARSSGTASLQSFDSTGSLGSTRSVQTGCCTFGVNPAFLDSKGQGRLSRSRPASTLPRVGVFTPAQPWIPPCTPHPYDYTSIKSSHDLKRPTARGTSLPGDPNEGVWHEYQERD